MTFRIEPLQKCHAQNWTGRLRGACQTWSVLKAYDENLGQLGTDLQKKLVQELLDEINRYCDVMAGNLFDPPIEFNSKDECVARCDDHTNPPVKVRFLPKKGMPGELSIKRRILEPCEQARLKIVKLVDRLNATRSDRLDPMRHAVSDVDVAIELVKKSNDSNTQSQLEQAMLAIHEIPGNASFLQRMLLWPEKIIYRTLKCRSQIVHITPLSGLPKTACKVIYRYNPATKKHRVYRLPL